MRRHGTPKPPSPGPLDVAVMNPGRAYQKLVNETFRLPSNESIDWEQYRRHGLMGDHVMAVIVDREGNVEEDE